MRPGDIIENPWTTQGMNPLHHSMYIRTSGKYFESLYYCQGEIKKARFYKENKEDFKVVGHLQEYDDFRNAVAKLARGSETNVEGMK